eukprot:230278-Chlamydomonas_euryale.AAC.11
MPKRPAQLCAAAATRFAPFARCRGGHEQRQAGMLQHTSLRPRGGGAAGRQFAAIPRPPCASAAASAAHALLAGSASRQYRANAGVVSLPLGPLRRAPCSRARIRAGAYEICRAESLIACAELSSSSEAACMRTAAAACAGAQHGRRRFSARSLPCCPSRLPPSLLHGSGAAATTPDAFERRGGLFRGWRDSGGRGGGVGDVNARTPADNRPGRLRRLRSVPGGADPPQRPQRHRVEPA